MLTVATKGMLLDHAQARHLHDAEVRCVRIGAHVGHAQQPLSVVHQRGAARIIPELAAEDGLRVNARLVDEAVDDAVEVRSLRMLSRSYAAREAASKREAHTA